MKHSFICPAAGQVLSTSAKNDDEALKKLLEIGIKHAKKFHAGQSPMSKKTQKR